MPATASPHRDPTGATAALNRLMTSESASAVRRAGLQAARLTYRTPRPVLLHRHELPILLNARGLVGCGVEVGVKEGEFSEALLDRWKGRHLISVDPWAAAPPDQYVDVANVTQEQHDGFHETAVKRLARFGDRSSVWRAFGEEAAERIPHHALDFVYIDARHDRPAVLEDLGQWFDRVRPGGVLAGHDYVDGLFPEGDFGVRSAVDEFFTAKGIAVGATRADVPWVSWYAVLPR